MKSIALFGVLFAALSIYASTAVGVERAEVKVSGPSRCETSGGDLTEEHVAIPPNLILPDAYCCEETSERAACLENKIETMNKLISFLRADIVLKLHTVYLLTCPTGGLLSIGGGSSCESGEPWLETGAEKIRRLENQLACLITNYGKNMEKDFSSRIEEMGACLDRREECEREKLHIRESYIEDLMEQMRERITCYDENAARMTQYTNELNNIITGLAGGPASCRFWDIACLLRRLTVSIPPPPSLSACEAPYPLMNGDPTCF